VLILSPIQLGTLSLDLPVVQKNPLIRLNHSNVSYRDQGHGYHHLNQPKPPITSKAGFTGPSH
jgi:hypothetical protein